MLTMKQRIFVAYKASALKQHLQQLVVANKSRLRLMFFSDITTNSCVICSMYVHVCSTLHQ